MRKLVTDLLLPGVLLGEPCLAVGGALWLLLERVQVAFVDVLNRLESIVVLLIMIMI